MSANKTTSSYWKTRMTTLPTKNGSDDQTNTLYIRVQFAGTREYLPLGTLDKTVGAERAKELYLLVLGEKLEEAKTKYAVRKHLEKKDCITVGDYLEVVKERGDLWIRTFTTYVNCLKLILSEILNLEKTKKRFSYRDGGNDEWTQKILDVPLSDISRDKVQTWRSSRIKAAGDDPPKVLAATRTANSNIRNARSLFSDKIVEKIGIMDLPDPRPFYKIKLTGNGSYKFTSENDSRDLLRKARSELKENKPEAYKVVVLAGVFGLRRGEIDTLERARFDLKRFRLTVSRTEFFRGKTDASEDSLDMEQEVADEIGELLKIGSSKFFVESPREAKSPGALRTYRCQEVFDEVIEWLRGQGVRGNKPLHILRKEVGAEIASEKGIYAAKDYLRHSTIDTTATYYADQKNPVTPGFGSVFKRSAQPSGRKRKTTGRMK